MASDLETLSPRELRADVPALERSTYLNYGAHGPSPRYVVEAMESFLATHEYRPGEAGPYGTAFGAYDRARSRIADSIGAEPEEVALTESTTDGINRFAGAIDFQPGDVVVRTDLEHPAGVLPWKRLESHGVEVRVLETEGGRVDTDAFAAAVEDARLVCFSAITWSHGTKLPVAELTEIAHEAGALVLVDAVQVPGQTRLDVHEWGADAVAAAGHKWLLGPWGAGFLYVRRAIANDLEPAAIGYRSVTDPGGETIEYKPGATRFEIGTTSPAPHVGLMEALETIDAVGIDRIQSRIERLTDRFKDAIPADRLLSPRAFESGLVTVAVDDPEATVDRLAAEDVVIRSLPFPDGVRVSIHAVSTGEEVDRVAELLDVP